jgi:hypothetical protein
MTRLTMPRTRDADLRGTWGVLAVGDLCLRRWQTDQDASSHRREEFRDRFDDRVRCFLGEVMADR